MLALSAAGISVWGGGESTVRRWSVQRLVLCGARTWGPAAGADTLAPAAKSAGDATLAPAAKSAGDATLAPTAGTATWDGSNSWDGTWGGWWDGTHGTLVTLWTQPLERRYLEAPFPPLEPLSGVVK